MTTHLEQSIVTRISTETVFNINYLKRSVLFVGFDAEEKDCLDQNFIESSPVKIDNITTMINMDKIRSVHRSKE